MQINTAPFWILTMTISSFFTIQKESSTDIVYTHALIYRYETLSEKGEFWIYHNPKTGSILFAPEDEMVDFVVADTLGNYYTFGNNGHDEKVVSKQHIDWIPFPKEGKKEDLPQSNSIFTFKPLSEKRTLYTAENNQKLIECNGFEMIYNKMIGQQKLFLTERIPLNSYQIYGFNLLQGDIKLPVAQLNLIDIVSRNQLATHIENDSFKLELIAYEYNPYHISPLDYQFYIQTKKGTWQKKKLPLKLL